MMPIHLQITWLFVMAIPVSCIAWTVTHEEVFREFNEFCKAQCKKGVVLKRKFFFLFTCEYCFSHYVTILFLIITKFQLLYEGWRGYIISGFSIVWIANCYMSIYAWLRTSLKKERLEATIKEKDVEEMDNHPTAL